MLVVLDSSVVVPFHSFLEIVGSDGTLNIPRPFRPGTDEKIYLTRGDKTETIKIKGQELYIGEVEDMADAILLGRDPRISLSTVYRTVRLLEGQGIVERHDFGDGRARYEPAGHDHHDHLINVKTGEVIEFKNEDIERLQERVAKELGFQLIGHRLELFGKPLKNGK